MPNATLTDRYQADSFSRNASSIAVTGLASISAITSGDSRSVLLRLASSLRGRPGDRFSATSGRRCRVKDATAPRLRQKAAGCISGGPTSIRAEAGLGDSCFPYRDQRINRCAINRGQSRLTQSDVYKGHTGDRIAPFLRDDLTIVRFGQDRVRLAFAGEQFGGRRHRLSPYPAAPSAADGLLLQREYGEVNKENAVADIILHVERKG